MLYRYSVENYSSYKEKAELSFIPIEPDQRHKVGDHIPVLKTAVIYGANASGKSNLIKSMEMACSIILNNKKLDQIKNPCYRLDKDSLHKPTIFSFEIKIDEKLYQYGFAALFYKSLILEEWLYELCEDGEKLLFARSYDDELLTYNTSFDTLNVLPPHDKKRLDVYADDMKGMKQKLFLTELAQKEVTESEFLDVINKVYRWFDKLTIVFPNSTFNLLVAVDADELKINDIYKEYFSTFDISIDNIHLEKVSISLLGLDEDIVAKISKDLDVKNKEKNRKVMLNVKGQEYLIELDEWGDLKAKEVKFRHKNRDVEQVDFRKDEESDGTQRLFDFIPVLSRLIKNECVVVIDEIDRSLHSLLTKRFLELFLTKSEKVRSQLICTTHEVLLLNLELLRKDEIWFVRKNTQGESQLYPLAQFNMKHLGELERNYLLGRYGAIPIF